MRERGRERNVGERKWSYNRGESSEGEMKVRKRQRMLRKEEREGKEVREGENDLRKRGNGRI